MKPEHGGGARRLASLIALGCLLGAATAAGTTVASAAPAVSAAPASADCGSGHANVEGYSTGYHYGNKAYIYVNTSTVIYSLHNALYRSLFIYVDGNNNVEIGWGAGPNSITGDFPTVYAYWVNRGTPGQRTYKSLSADTNYRFRVENDGHIEIFRFYFNGESSPFKYSPTMNFDTGYPLSNSERYNYCDSLWTHMYDLSYQTSDGSWSSDWGNWTCWNNTSQRNPYYFHKDSNSELHVTTTSSGGWGYNCAS